MRFTFSLWSKHCWEKKTAVASFDRALKVRPHYAEALSNRGLTLYELRRFD